MKPGPLKIRMQAQPTEHGIQPKEVKDPLNNSRQTCRGREAYRKDHESSDEVRNERNDPKPYGLKRCRNDIRPCLYYHSVIEFSLIFLTFHGKNREKPTF
jgi:hypothetical protein